jgi:hypothetical protein
LGETVIPFELVGNKPLVPARVDGEGPFAFLLDNGSSYNVVDTRVANGLGLAASGADELRGAGEATLSSSAAAASLTLSDLELARDEVVVMPLDAAIGSSTGRHVDGLFGYPLFARFQVELCYAGSNVVLHDPPRQRWQGTSVPIEVVREHAMVEASLELPDGRRIAGTFMVDTAVRSPLLLTRGFVEEQRIVESLPRRIQTTTGWGIGGPTRDIVGRAEAFELGSLRFERPVVVCSTAKSGVLSERGWAGIIGGEVLRRCHVVVDYGNGVMTLEPNSDFAQPFEHDHSGLFLVAEGVDFELLRTHDVVPGSPAARAGIRPGDVLATVDGTPPSDLEEAKRLLRAGPDTTYRIGIVREGSRIETALTLRRLV